MSNDMHINRELFVLMRTAAIRLKRIDVFKQELRASEKDLRHWLDVASPEVVNKFKASFPEVFEWLNETQDVDSLYK